MPTFTVDTHVFRELGELLVGRDSTALVELIKNSYDADATEVVVYGTSLNDTQTGMIVVADNGVGMDEETFGNGFLRIASRTKDTGERRSKEFKRRYTGAKGIGRLAAHKLARILEVESLTAANGGVTARIDWDAIEKKETLDQVGGSDAITVSASGRESHAQPGTKITLRNLRRRWTASEHNRFLEEVQSFSPPKVLIEAIPRGVTKRNLLFERPRTRDSQKEADFSVKLEGDLAPPEDYWAAALAAATWILEIDALTERGMVHFCVAPTMRSIEGAQEELKPRRFRLRNPGGDQGPQFQGRILLRTGTMKGEEKVRAWSGRASGVRVYMEGFRVLPYGEARNDWLALDRDVTERTTSLLSQDVIEALAPALKALPDDRPGLLHLPNKHYFGAVFLMQRHAPSLRMLVNREGFVPDAAYDSLVTVVRTGIDLMTRVRATVTAKERYSRRQERAKRSLSTDASGSPSIVETLAEAERHAAAARRHAAAGEGESATLQLDLALARIKNIADASDELIDQAAMLRVLASLGTQLSSFVHELNGLLGMAETIEKALQKVVEGTEDLGRPQRSQLRAITKSVADLRRHIERHASYLVDVVSVDARRRRSRQALHARFSAAQRLVQTAADRRGIQILNNLPEPLKSPPMFAAELTTLFANLLTNAIKAAGENGRIKATGRETSAGSIVRVENTGKEVKLSTSERWFQPFESSTAQVDPTLGQGMGLGLTITRAMLEEYGATIKFVKPSRSFATALEVSFNG